MNQIFKTESQERIVFHYNKKHNEDTNIPQWIIKVKGQTFYVHHLNSEVGFSTKETPGNPHTKGSLQFKGVLTITEENEIITATIK